MGKDMPPDHIIKRGYLRIQHANYEFFGEWQRLPKENFQPNGVGVARIKDKAVIVGTFDQNGPIFGSPYAYADLETKKCGVFCLNKSRPDGQVFEIGVQMSEDMPDAWGVF